MSEIKVNLRQCSQGVDVNINQTEQDITASFYSGIMLVHDYTLQGNGTSTTPLGISQEILDRIDDAGKVNDVYVNGVSVLAADKIAYVIVPTNVSDLNNDLNFQTLTQVSNAISVHNESSTSHADIRQDIANVSDSIATSIATHNTSVDAHSNIISPIAQTLDSHVTNKSNPHEVTKAQVGLGNVDNTSDLDKPISTATQAALNAQQEEIDALSGRGRFLSLWNCATGLAESNPPESPYPYKAGDYFVVGTVSSATPAVNYKPDGSSYTTGVASTVVETNEVSVNDTYFYDGTVWKLQSNAQKEVSFSALAGSPYDNTNLSTALNSKQNTLTAGTNISIVNDVISSTAQESFFRGNFNEWSDVPTDTSSYQEDIHGNRVPKDTDFIIVEDASQFIPSGSLMHKLVVENIDSTEPFTIRITDENGVSKKYYWQTYRGEFVEIDDFYSLLYVPGVPGIWYIKTNDGSPIITKGVRYQSGESQLCTTSDPATPFDVGMPPSVGQYTGAWRFAYYGVWSTTGIIGWTPQYKIENTLPIADATTLGIAKLYNTTGNNTDGSMTQASVTTALGTKQDTLTAGTNIDITNNVISATAQESFFRGKFSTWTSVPTDPTQYYPNYKDETTPTSNDYMVVEDASGYVKPGIPIQIYNEPMVSSIAYVRFVFGATDITLNHYIVSQRGEEGVIIGTVGNQLRITYASAVWKVTPLDVPVIVDGVTKPINEIALFWSYQNPSQETLYKEINFAGQGGYVGTWRFGYQSDDWDASGKNGWEPEYQVEDVLPIADSSTAGIAKLYTTTGSNTDGAIDQNGTTNAISSAVSTHNTDTTAHSNIRGTANGLATLDGNAKVPLSQMNDAVLGNVSYQGLWNASTNDPFLPNPSGELPTGYTQYGWIKTVSGKPYIDTGISYDYANEDEITVETKLNYLSTASAGYSSFGFTSGNGGIFIYKTWSGVPTVNVGGLTASIASETDTVVSMKVDKTIGQKSITIDGTTTYGAISSFANLNIYVLSVNNGGTPSSNQSYVKFYYVNISKSGTLLARLLPCKRNSDDAVGMYDTVRNTFYPVAGGVAEVGGAIEIPKGHYYITSTAGTQFGIHFEVGDWVISNGTSWTKVDNTDAVSSVEGRTGNVTVINDSASTGATTYTWSADKLTTEFGSLGTAAYTASTDYATAAQGAKADTALQSADVQEYTANEVETLWNSI